MKRNCRAPSSSHPSLSARKCSRRVGELSRPLHDGQGFYSVPFRVRESLQKVAGIRSAFNLLRHARAQVDVSPFFVLKTKDIFFSGRSLTWFFNVCCDGRGKQKREKCRQLRKCFLPLETFALQRHGNEIYNLSEGKETFGKIEKPRALRVPFPISPLATHEPYLFPQRECK